MGTFHFAGNVRVFSNQGGLNVEVPLPSSFLEYQVHPHSLHSRNPHLPSGRARFLCCILFGHFLRPPPPPPPINNILAPIETQSHLGLGQAVVPQPPESPDCHRHPSAPCWVRFGLSTFYSGLINIPIGAFVCYPTVHIIIYLQCYLVESETSQTPLINSVLWPILGPATHYLVSFRRGSTSIYLSIDGG